jgi:aldehyde dehydrogenase (NAD+)
MSAMRALYIDGEWVETDDSIDNINPSDTTDSLGRYAQATPALADQAINSANRAAVEWGQSPMETRYQVLMAIGNELIDRGCRGSVSIGAILSLLRSGGSSSNR